MSQYLCQYPGPAVALPLPELDDVVRDVLSKRSLVRRPSERAGLIFLIWVVNGALALILSFLIGFCMGEGRGTAGPVNAPALHAAPAARPSVPNQPPIGGTLRSPG
jgi:hypothetical protein